MRLNYKIELGLEEIDTICTAEFSADVEYQECDNDYELELSKIALGPIIIDKQGVLLKSGEVREHALNEIIYQVENNTEQFYDETKTMIMTDALA